MALADGTRVFVGDQVATRRNDARVVAADGAAVRNPPDLDGDGRRGRRLVDGGRSTAWPSAPSEGLRRPAVELGWAVTGYGKQGVTVDHGICVVEPASTRAGIYVAMTRGRGRNLAWVLDRTGLGDAEEGFRSALTRPPGARTAHAVRDQLYRAAGATPPATAPRPEALPEDPARRMAECLKQLPTHRPPARRLGR